MISVSPPCVSWVTSARFSLSLGDVCIKSPLETGLNHDSIGVGVVLPTCVISARWTVRVPGVIKVDNKRRLVDIFQLLGSILLLNWHTHPGSGVGIVHPYAQMPSVASSSITFLTWTSSVVCRPMSKASWWVRTQWSCLLYPSWNKLVYSPGVHFCGNELNVSAFLSFQPSSLGILFDLRRQLSSWCWFHMACRYPWIGYNGTIMILFLCWTWRRWFFVLWPTGVTGRLRGASPSSRWCASSRRTT